MKEVTSNLGKSYKQWKDSEKGKNAAKDAFFAEVSKQLSREVVPAQICQRVKAQDGLAAQNIITKKFPTHYVVDIECLEDGIFDFVLEEDVTLRPFSYVNEDDGMVYQRQVIEGSSMLDDERMRAENPSLWEEITYIPNERVMKPLENLSDSQLESLREFMYSGRPVIKLAAPRKAKSEELETKDK